MFFNKRLLMYETNSSDNNDYDYGEISQILSDRLINVDMGGSGYILESVQVDSGYVPKLGDWVEIQWQNGNPIAKGSNGNGLNDVNTPVIVSQSDMGSGTVNGDHIRANSIDADHLQAGSVTADAISANSITATAISANSIQTQHISANSITGDKIAAGAITSDNIQAGSINSTSISANSISTVQLQANSVTAQQISANSIQTQHISANSIIASQIKADQINASHISANSITSDEITANAIQAQHISANSVTAQSISANSIQTQHISANTITAGMVQANQINANHISANSINAGHLQANSVTAQSISANSIQTQHISANSIIASQIKADQINASHISANSITSDEISANAIQAQHISANAVTAQSISANSIQTQHISANTVTASMVQANQINANHITANAITATAISANAIQTKHISANTITAGMISANQINASHISSNSIMSNMVSANQIQANHISANSIQAQHISANSVTAQAISANSIQTQHISANSITGDKIQANQISGNHIVAGTITADHLAVGTIQEGLLGQYYTYSAGATNHFQYFKGSQVDNTINFSWSTGSPTLIGQADNFAVRWQGFIQAPQTGQYTFCYTADDAGKVVVNNTSVINIATYTNGLEVSGNISLTAGQWYSILVEMWEGTGGATAILKWIKPDLTKEVIPQKYFTQGNTQIDGAQIITGTITADNIQVGTITADSGIIGTAAIKTANIASGNITSALIGYGEIKTANIASGNITNALIANATIDHAKIISVDAGTITVGQLDGAIIKAGTISGNQILAQSITADRLKTGTIDTVYIKAGAIVTDTISAGAVTTDKIEAGAITGDLIRAGSITAEHISTIGLDAQLVQVYNSATGETLIGSGYLRVDGLDVGVVQSDNLMQNGLFLASSSDYGFKRLNPSGEALLGNTLTGVGSHQVWKIDLTSGNVVKTIDIPAKKPFDIGIHPTGNYAYITVQGDNTLLQLDIVQDTLTQNKLNMGMGPARIKWRDMQMENMDMKHFFVLNTDPDSMFIPDSLMVVDTPPSSVNGDLYVHHEIALGINPYDFVTNDTNKMTYVTMASQGDIIVIDTTDSNSFNWKVKGRLPISAFGTDNNHGDLPSQFGMNEVLGGDASAQYNDSSMGTMSGMGGMDAMSGYGASDGSLRKYEPHGIALSSDPNTLYVVDYANGELVIVDINGNAPYNYLIGTTATGSFQGSPDTSMGGMSMSGGTMNTTTTSTSPTSLSSNGEVIGGGPGTYYVRYRIPIGDSPDFIQVVNGKIFITLEGSNGIAVIDESSILNEINADNSYYGTRTSNGSFTNWNTSQPMRTVNQPNVRMVMGIGTSPSFMKANGTNLYVSVSGDNQIAVVNTSTEMVTKTINVGTNPKGFDITPDGKYMYVANYGGIGDLSFIYPQGTFIGDPFMALEGGIMYQGADGWTPDRSDWVYDASGNIQSKSTVEFHINEPLKNEGGYAKLTSYGIDPQYAQIEQDIINVENYSNGNNIVVVTGGRLANNYDDTVWTPKEGSFISGTVHNVMIGSILSGNTIMTSANSFTVNYSLNQVIFSANAIGSGNWVQADYTAPNNIYFKTHNSSLEIAVDNGSSPNFATSFQVDEFVPNFVAVDNRQTSLFTPTADGINDTYEGLEYSVITNRALNIPSGSVTMSGGSSLSSMHYGGSSNTYDISRVVDGDTNTNNYYDSGSGNANVKLDLGSIYMVGEIRVWHYYSDGRKYHKTKTEISEDGVTWTTVFDSAISGEYTETSDGHTIMFDAKPTRYVRDWLSGNTSNGGNHWVEIQAFGDWQVEKGYTYPSNSTKSGQQIATNGIGFVSTDIPKAYIAMNVQVNFTSWWWMTYIVGPDFGRIRIEMPTLMNSGHFLNQQAPFVNNVAHRHIMSFPPSAMIQTDSMNNIESGKHRVIIRQDSGKVTLDRLRFDDFQMYKRSTLAIPSQSGPATFTRYKVIAEQAKWYQGKGRQSTEGAYDTPRTNSDTGQPDYSVPIKYRVRVLSQLSPTGQVQERGTIYVTSAIFETGKQSTHWRRSESSDVFAGNKIESWNPSQPMNTGIQSGHLADGAVRSSKILPNAVYDYHISNYARIQEHKLELNYPTHDHANKTFLDTMTGFAGTSGNYGTSNSVSRGDHNHDSQYLTLSGGQITNTLNTKSIYTNGNVNVTGNITITGTVDGVDVSNLNSSYATTSGNLTNHIGSGGSAHAVVTTSSNGFMISTDKSKLDGIQSSAINQTTTDGRYVQISGSTMVNTLTVSGSAIGLTLKGGSTDQIYMQLYARSGNQGLRTGWIGYGSTGTTTMTIANENSGNVNITTVGSGALQHNGYTIWDSNNVANPATQAWVTGNYYTQSYLNTVLVDATESTHGFLSASDKTKLDGISANSINQSYTDSRYLQLTGGNINGNLTFGVNEIRAGGSNSNSLVISSPTGGSIYLRPNGDAGTDSQFIVASGTVTFNNYSIWHTGSLLDPATKTWISGNYYNTSTIDAKLIDATEATHGFMSTSDKIKLDGISSNSINQAYADTRYLQLTGGALNGSLSVTGNIAITGTVDGVDVSNLNSAYATTSSNVTNHIGSGGTAHPVATSGSAGFMGTSDRTKLDGIQTSAINQTTADGRYLQLTGGYINGNLTVTGNIVVTGTVDGVDVSTLNTNVNNHIGSGGSAHAVAISGGANGFIDGTNYGKLLRIQDNAINQTTADGRYYIQNQSVKVIADNTIMGIDTGSIRMGMYKKSGQSPAMAVASGNSFTVYEMNTADLSTNISGTSTINTLLNINSSTIQYKGNDIWHKGTLADPATQTWISGNYYNQTTVTSMVGARGDVFQANANTFTNLNTFSNAGMSIKIQPSASVSNTTKLLQMNNAVGGEVFSVNYTGGVVISGDFTVTGQQIVSGTTNVNGDYTISGQLIVGGNATLGDSSTDVTTVNGTLKVSGNIEQIGAYQEVHRRPLFGIAGDLQFQTSSTTFDTVVDFYDLTKFGSPSAQNGSTRYYRIYVIYSDDINSTQTSGGQQATLRIAGGTNKDLVLNQTWGSPNGRRDWYSAYFTDLPTGNGNLQAMLAQSGNNLGIRWIELIAYDKF